MTTWPVAKLGELCDVQIGKTPRRSENRYWTDDHPWLSIADMNQGKELTQTKEKISQTAVDELNCRLVEPGTVLLSFKLSIGKVGIAAQPMYTNEAIAHLPIVNKSLNGDYLYWALRTIPLTAGADRAAMGSTLNKKKLNEIPIPLPPLEEQKRIAAILDAADQLRTKRQQSIDKLGTLEEAIFNKMFGDPVSNTAGWDRSAIGSLCNLVRGSSPRPKGDPRYYGGPVPRLMIADISRDGFSVTPTIDSLTIEGASLSRPVPSGTVVMTVSGNVGVVAKLAVDACIHDGFVAFLDVKEGLIRPDFLLRQLDLSKTIHMRNTAGAIFQNITTKDIKALNVVIPPITLQDEYLGQLESLIQLRGKISSSDTAFSNSFASLQQRAFRGDL